jgi:hypothetical protein
MNKLRRILLIVGLVTVASGVFYLMKAGSVWRVNATQADFNADVENLFTGLQQYKQHVGSYPAGSNGDIVKALQGNNSNKVIIVVGHESDLSTKGEFVDPWGTPLRIYFSKNGVLVRSAGQNKRFDDSTAVSSDDFFRSN